MSRAPFHTSLGLAQPMLQSYMIVLLFGVFFFFSLNSFNWFGDLTYMEKEEKNCNDFIFDEKILIPYEKNGNVEFLSTEET